MHTAISQPKDLIPSREIAGFPISQLLNPAREFDSQDLSCLWGNVVLSFSLHQVHAIKSEGVDFDKSLGFAWLRLGHLAVHKEGGNGPYAIFDI
jgi:hypothetical protein